MALFGLLGTKVKDPKVESLRKEDKEIFALTKEELDSGKTTISYLKEARQLIELAIRNTKDLLELVRMGKPPRHHDFDFEDVQGEYEKANRLLEKARNASVAFHDDLKRLTQHLFNAESLLKDNFEKVGHKSFEDVELFKNTEYTIIGEFPSLDEQINILITLLYRDVIPLLKDLADEEKLSNKEMNELSTLSKRLTSDVKKLYERAERFEKILHNVNKRMRKLEFADKHLEKEVLSHLKKARTVIKDAHNYEGGYDR